MIWDVTASPAVVAGTVYVASIATSDSGHVNAIEGDTP